VCPFGSETPKAVLGHHAESHLSIPYSYKELILDYSSGKFYYQSKHFKKRPCTDLEELSTRKDDANEPLLKKPKYNTELDELKALLESVVPRLKAHGKLEYIMVNCHKMFKPPKGTFTGYQLYTQRQNNGNA